MKAYYVSEEQFAQVDWSRVTNVCIYLDTTGQLHFELHHGGFTPLNSATAFFEILCRPRHYYQQLPNRMIAKSRFVDQGSIIGARQLILIPQLQRVLCANIGIVSRESAAQRGATDAVRRSALDRLEIAAQRIARAIHATHIFGVTAVIPDDKMRRFGWVPYQCNSVARCIFKNVVCFPLLHQRAYTRPIAQEIFSQPATSGSGHTDTTHRQVIGA